MCKDWYISECTSGWTKMWVLVLIWSKRDKQGPKSEGKVGSVEQENSQYQYPKNMANCIAKSWPTPKH